MPHPRKLALLRAESESGPGDGLILLATTGAGAESWRLSPPGAKPGMARGAGESSPSILLQSVTASVIDPSPLRGPPRPGSMRVTTANGPRPMDGRDLSIRKLRWFPLGRSMS